MGERVGLQIGDGWLTWSCAGETARVPARVGALVRSGSGAGEVGYLLAGDEAAGDADAVQWPRRVGYRWSDEATAGAILQALFARVRQGLPSGAFELVLALPFWVREQDRLVEAARRAGWAEVAVVTDLYALLMAHLDAADGVDVVLTLVPGSDLLDAGAWRRRADGGWHPLAWEQWGRGQVAARLAGLLGRVGACHAAVLVGGDLVAEWAPELDQATAPGQLELVDLGPGAVAEAAAAAMIAAPLPLLEHVVIETADGSVFTKGPGEAPEAWLALKGGGLPVTVRVRARWGAEAPGDGVVLWERTVQSDSDPLLLHLDWRAGVIRAVTPDGKELCRGGLVRRGG
ncbi:MAG TPA: hypothetical protein VK464_18805 [Symbiobacteriaceae bacterium]|jgi:hypothetical protein|nr:hypothetical protein [Symbiobacteriaceae bacterium]